MILQVDGEVGISFVFVVLFSKWLSLPSIISSEGSIIIFFTSTCKKCKFFLENFHLKFEYNKLEYKLFNKVK